MILSSRDLKRPKVAEKEQPKSKVLQAKDIYHLIKTEDKTQTWKMLIEKGILDGDSFERDYGGIDNCLLGLPIFLIGGGPPLKPFLKKYGWNFFDDKLTMGINHMIEDYDNLDFHFFLDKRFPEITTYEMSKFKGTYFAQCTSGMKPSENTRLFYCRNDKPGDRFKDGLYSPGFSGLAALNLALIMGADPIYLIGFGNGETGTFKNYHYKNDYTGEIKEVGRFNKFKRVYTLFNRFKDHAHKVYHVTDGDDIPTFTNKIRTDEIEAHLSKKEEIKISQRPRIVHYSFTGNINKHAEITRHIVSKGYGKHFLLDINSGSVPDADLYIMEHFLSTDKKVNTFPCPEKTIDIVHTVNCTPRLPFKKVVALTESWKRILEKQLVKNIEVIHGGIDLKPFERVSPNKNKMIGRITRWSPGKIHPDWNKTIKGILDNVEGSAAIFYTQLDQSEQRKPLYDYRITYDKSCKIDSNKAKFLKRLSVYIHMNGSFKDTLSFGVIEAMATGLPIVYLSEGTGVIEEVTGPAGICCYTPEEVKQQTIKLLNDSEMRAEYSRHAKEQVKKFDKDIMLEKFDRLIKECLD